MVVIVRVSLKDCVLVGHKEILNYYTDLLMIRKSQGYYDVSPGSEQVLETITLLRDGPLLSMTEEGLQTYEEKQFPLSESVILYLLLSRKPPSSIYFSFCVMKTDFGDKVVRNTEVLFHVRLRLSVSKKKRVTESSQCLICK